MPTPEVAQCSSSGAVFSTLQDAVNLGLTDEVIQRLKDDNDWLPPVLLALL